MLECFLLLGKVGAAWAPLIAIPAMVAGSVAAMYLIFSGIKGIITQGGRPKHRAVRAASPGAWRRSKAAHGRGMLGELTALPPPLP
jgi:hypothetical protein